MLSYEAEIWPIRSKMGPKNVKNYFFTETNCTKVDVQLFRGISRLTYNPAVRLPAFPDGKTCKCLTEVDFERTHFEIVGTLNHF